MTLTRINGRTVDVGRTIILIEDIGLGGLCFLTDLKLTINPNIIFEFDTYLERLLNCLALLSGWMK